MERLEEGKDPARASHSKQKSITCTRSDHYFSYYEFPIFWVIYETLSRVGATCQWRGDSENLKINQYKTDDRYYWTFHQLVSETLFIIFGPYPCGPTLAPKDNIHVIVLKSIFLMVWKMITVND